MSLAHHYAQAHSNWVVAPTTDFGLIRMEGPDRQGFLQRLLTNDVTSGPGCHAFYLNVQGRPLVEFWLFEAEPQQTLLLTPQEQLQGAYQELDKMHFGEKLKFAIDASIQFVVSAGPTRPAAAQALHFPYYSVEHDLLLLPAAEADAYLADCTVRGAHIVSQELLEVLRLEAARPRLSELSEKTLFLEFAAESDYSESKGCYPGQEVVARILHRGHINKKVCLLRLQGSLPERGSPLLREGQEVGNWFTGLHHPLGYGLGLGIVRRGSWEPGTVLTGADGREIVIESPKRKEA